MSVTFTNGPAQGQHLELARVPLLLRAVVSAAGVWDALDLLEDEPRPGETVTAYRRAGEPTVMFLTSQTGRGRRRERIVSARYEVVDPQPAEAVLRDTAAWQAWCRAAAQAVASAHAAAAPEIFGLPDTGAVAKGCRAPLAADVGQGRLFGGHR